MMGRPSDAVTSSFEMPACGGLLRMRPEVFLEVSTPHSEERTARPDDALHRLANHEAQSY
jgi:hypothetical protein